MKILLISPIPPPAGGMAVWTEQYLSYMKGNNYKVDLVNTSVTGKRVQNYTNTCLREEISRSLRMACRVFGLLIRNKYDVVHFNTSCSRNGLIRDKVIFDILQLFREKIVLQCHCNIRNAICTRRSYVLFRKMAKRTQKCLVLNRDSYDFIKDNYQVEATIVPNFITNEYKIIALQSRTNQSDVKTLLFVGHLLRTKGCNIIIEVAKYFPDVQFRMVGHVSKEIAAIPKPDNVIITGEKDHAEVLTEYENADALLFPTHSEGFPLTIIEAMAYGLPIITTKVGAIFDILEERGAIYIPVGDCEELKKSIEVLKDKSVRDAMSEFNKNKVASAYLINRVLGDLCELYS